MYLACRDAALPLYTRLDPQVDCEKCSFRALRGLESAGEATEAL